MRWRSNNFWLAIGVLSLLGVGGRDGREGMSGPGGLQWMAGLGIFGGIGIRGVGAQGVGDSPNGLPMPSYHFGAPIPVECLNRSVDTGEHIEGANHELEYVPFPICEETGKPLEFNYGVEEELNCTLPLITDPTYHLLEFYIHHDSPFTCRLPSRPPSHISVPSPPPQEFIPLVFALAGTLQLSHLHISTHLNVLLHSVPKHHLHHHDSGVIDSGAAYSTSPLDKRLEKDGGTNKRVVIGDSLPLQFSVRWFPTPHLPRENGKVEWAGLGGHVFWSTLWYCLLSFGAGGTVVGVWVLGWEVPRRWRDGVGVGRASRGGGGLGGATPLGWPGGVKGGGAGGIGESNGNGVGNNGKVKGRGVGNGWGIATGAAAGVAGGKRD